MKINSLHDFYVDQLKDAYSAEKQQVKALPKMAKAALTDDLKLAFEHHFQQTEKHMETILSILDKMGESSGNKKCKAMKGLLKEGRELTKAKGDAKAKDAALILAAQKVEHYEIATYGGLRTFANSLGLSDVADKLQSILNEEYDADQKLDDLAMGGGDLLSEGLNAEAKA